MQQSFIDYLHEEGLVTSDQVTVRRGNTGSPQSWIGQLMLNHGLIGVEEINEILRRQDLHRGLFGENAMALGYVTQSQLDALLAAQELRRNIELLEDLALSGCIEFEEGLAALCQYYARARASRGTRRAHPASSTTEP